MKKNIPYILAMILMIPFFVLAVLALGSQGGGKEILNTNMSWTVVKEGGVLESREGMPVDLNIEEDGRYNLSFSWDVEEPGFLTGMTIKDAAGNTVFNTSAFQLQISNESIFLKEGNYTINTEFFTTEDEFRKFAEENSSYKSQSELDSYISAVGFDSFEPDSEARFSFAVNVTKQYSAPVRIKIFMLATGLAIIALCVIILINSRSNTGATAEALIENTNSGETPNANTVLKSSLDSIGIAYSVFSIVVTCVQLFISLGLSLLPIELTPNINSLITFGMVILSVDIIGFPLIYILTKMIPARDIPNRKFGFFKFLPYIFMTFAIMLPGSIIGSLIHSMLTVPFGGSGANAVTEILFNSSPIPRIITVGILAPIFEELIFRKLLVDRLSRYSSFMAIIVSGLFFGLYHGNFAQFFFATGIGFLFAFLYTKTGKIHLTIILHMIVNLFTSVITTTAIQKFLALNPNRDLSQEYLMAHPEAAAALGGVGLVYVTMGVLAFIGIICFIVFAVTKKFRLEKIEGEPTKAEALKALFSNKYAWLFILSAIGLFIISYLPVMLGI
ncbi:MAG: CPBP family intramembrane metalloprotease [Lachnospiraceae bacterium]|nr:CPBP family intramembrane metalloprotease [Lachnospiraceae bacterium]